MRLTVKEAENLGLEVPKKKSKYCAQHERVDGIRFDSKKEARRYRELRTLASQGHIRELRLQVIFQFFAAGIEIDRWRVDFTYIDHIGRKIAEDPTGYLTAKKKRMITLFKQQYPEWNLIIS